MNYYIREYGVTKAEGFRLAWQDMLQDLGDTLIGGWIEGSLSAAGQSLKQTLTDIFDGKTGKTENLTGECAPENRAGLLFSPELYRMGLELAAPDGYGEGTYVTAPLPGIRNNNQLETSESGSFKAIPYSQRGIELEPRLTQYMDQLTAENSYISDKTGTYSMEDLQILTAETGVEYTMLNIAGQSYLIRGNERGTSIPNELAELLYNKQGDFVCHSHPFVGDLNPSLSDLNFIKSLTWLSESIIIDPTGDMVVFDKNGVKEKQTISTKKDDDYYQKMFGGIE